MDKLYLSEPANDLWIRDVIFPNLLHGYFVEAGAADGFAGSSCYLLEKQLHWTGICIEPHDEFFRLLVKNRPGSIHANVCLADQAGWVEFASGGGVSPYLSGVSNALARKHRGAEVLAQAAITRKPAETLANLLRRHHAPGVIEYGAFDIEGSEYEALRSFPFDEYRFLALTFEIDNETRAPLTQLLTGHGYLETRNPYNLECPWEKYWIHESIAGRHIAPSA